MLYDPYFLQCHYFFSDLVVRQGKPEDVIPDIISQLGKDNVEALVYQKEVNGL